MSRLSIDTLIYVGAILVAITLICVLLTDNRESYYTSLGHFGKFSPHVNDLSYTEVEDDDEPISLKYRGHRYNRKRFRGIKQYPST
jgi:hypothetical protein